MATRRGKPDLPETAGTTTTKAAKAPKGSKAPKQAKVVELDSDGNPVKKGRRVMGERNWLATEIDAVLRNSSGPVKVNEIVDQIKNKEGEHPSSGAVAAAIIRWSDAGYIQTTTKPLAFKSFPAKWKASNLTSFLEKQHEIRMTDRRAAKAAASA